MAEIVVVGAFTAKPGKEQDAKEAFQRLIEPTHEEPGCILYALHQSADDPARLALLERWASREELDAHLKSDCRCAPARRQALSDLRHHGLHPVARGRIQKGSLAEHAGSAA